MPLIDVSWILYGAKMILNRYRLEIGHVNLLDNIVSIISRLTRNSQMRLPCGIDLCMWMCLKG